MMMTMSRTGKGNRVVSEERETKRITGRWFVVVKGISMGFFGERRRVKMWYWFDTVPLAGRCFFTCCFFLC